MRPVNRGECPKDAAGNEIGFTHYREARDYLVNRIGDYCSYCEVCPHSSIAVEHVRPKKLQSALELKWTNFLLACDNCNSVKSDEDVNLLDYFWPDRDNTARAFNYDHNEPPYVASGLNSNLRAIAERTITLTGLDRVPGHVNFSKFDRRWLKRCEAWGVAILARQDLEENNTSQMRDYILQTAIARGFWSVWLQVFDDDKEIRSRLINWFQGTAADCFDGHTRPIKRPGGPDLKRESAGGGTSRVAVGDCYPKRVKRPVCSPPKVPVCSRPLRM